MTPPNPGLPAWLTGRDDRSPKYETRRNDSTTRRRSKGARSMCESGYEGCIEDSPMSDVVEITWEGGQWTATVVRNGKVQAEECDVFHCRTEAVTAAVLTFPEADIWAQPERPITPHHPMLVARERRERYRREAARRNAKRTAGPVTGSVPGHGKPEGDPAPQAG